MCRPIPSFINAANGGPRPLFQLVSLPHPCPRPVQTASRRRNGPSWPVTRPWQEGLVTSVSASSSQIRLNITPKRQRALCKHSLAQHGGGGLSPCHGCQATATKLPWRIGKHKSQTTQPHYFSMSEALKVYTASSVSC